MRPNPAISSDSPYNISGVVINVQVHHGYEMIFIKFIGWQQSLGPALGSDAESQTLHVKALEHYQKEVWPDMASVIPKKGYK